MPQTITCTRFGLIVAFFTVLGLMTASPLQAQSLEESLRDYSLASLDVPQRPKRP